MKGNLASICLLTQVHFSSTKKSHKLLRCVQFVVFEKFLGAYLHKVTQEIMLLLVNNLHG